MIPALAQQQDQSYEYLSSEQILIEFGQLQPDLVGSLLTAHQITGPFGTAELYPNLHDRLLLLDPTQDTLSINDRIYRGVVVKTARKKDVRSAEVVKGDEEENENEREREREREENMFESSEEEREEKKGRGRREGKGGEKGRKKTRIIRKLKSISEKKGKE